MDAANTCAAVKGRCYVVGAGDFHSRDFAPDPAAGDMIIAVDGGYTWLEQRHAVPDLVIGDFDSLGFVPSHPRVVSLAKEKDDTDMSAALAEGLRAGYRDFRIFGGTGGRFDHTLANIQALARLSQNGSRGFLYDTDSIITAVTDATLSFESGYCGYISVFSHTERSCGVWLHGLKYPLADAVLTNTYPLGVSNEFTGTESSVTVGQGTLIVVYPYKQQR